MAIQDAVSANGRAGSSLSRRVQAQVEFEDEVGVVVKFGVEIEVEFRFKFEASADVCGGLLSGAAEVVVVVVAAAVEAEVGSEGDALWSSVALGLSIPHVLPLCLYASRMMQNGLVSLVVVSTLGSMARRAEEIAAYAAQGDGIQQRVGGWRGEEKYTVAGPGERAKDDRTTTQQQ